MAQPALDTVQAISLSAVLGWMLFLEEKSRGGNECGDPGGAGAERAEASIRI